MSFMPMLGDLYLEAWGQLSLWPLNLVPMDGSERARYCYGCNRWIDRRTGAGHWAACLTLNPRDPS